MGNRILRKKEKIEIEKSKRSFNHYSVSTQNIVENGMDSNVESVCAGKLVNIIWLDSRSVHQDDVIDTRITKNILLTALQNSVLICFSDTSSCIEFLQQHQDTVGIIFLVISRHDSIDLFNALNPDLARCIDSIFIFCLAKKLCEVHLLYGKKVIGIYNEHMELLQSLQEQAVKMSQQDLLMKYYNTTQKTARIVPSYAKGEFIWIRVVKEAALKVERTDKAMKKMCDRFRILYRRNITELKKIDEFEKDYHPDNAIQWYTKDSFLYRIINQSLRTEDTKELLLFSPYIADLCRAIRALQTKIDKKMKFFRGCTLSRTALNEFNANIGSLLSINSFFSATRQRDVAKAFASCHALNGINTLVSVVFEIEVKHDELTFFADITGLSVVKDEDEVLFDLNAIFTIQNVIYSDDDECWVIHLVTDEETYIKHEYIYKELCEIFEFNTSPLITIGISSIMTGNTRVAYDYALSTPFTYNSMTGSTSLFLLTCVFECDYSRALHTLKVIYEAAEKSKSFEIHHQWTHAACWIADILVTLGEFQLASQYIHSITRYYRTVKQCVDSYQVPVSLEYLEDLEKALETKNEVEANRMFLIHFEVEKMPSVLRALLLPSIHTCLARSYVNVNCVHEALHHVRQAEIEGELLLSQYALIRQDINLIYACIFLHTEDFDQCNLHLTQMEKVARMNLSQSSPSALGCVHLLKGLVRILQENTDTKSYLSLARRAFLLTFNYIDIPKVVFVLGNMCKIHKKYRNNLNSCIIINLEEFVKEAFEICRFKKIMERKSPENIYRPLCNYVQHLGTSQVEDIQIEQPRKMDITTNENVPRFLLNTKRKQRNIKPFPIPQMAPFVLEYEYQPYLEKKEKNK